MLTTDQLLEQVDANELDVLPRVPRGLVEGDHPLFGIVGRNDFGWIGILFKDEQWTCVSGQVHALPSGAEDDLDREVARQHT